MASDRLTAESHKLVRPYLENVREWKVAVGRPLGHVAWQPTTQSGHASVVGQQMFGTVASDGLPSRRVAPPLSSLPPSKSNNHTCTPPDHPVRIMRRAVAEMDPAGEAHVAYRKRRSRYRPARTESGVAPAQTTDGFTTWRVSAPGATALCRRQTP